MSGTIDLDVFDLHCRHCDGKDHIIGIDRDTIDLLFRCKSCNSVGRIAVCDDAKSYFRDLIDPRNAYGVPREGRERCARRVDLEAEYPWDSKYFYCCLRRGHSGRCRKPEKDPRNADGVPGDMKGVVN